MSGSNDQSMLGGCVTRLLRVVFVLAVILAVIGYFRGWISFERADEETITKITLTIDHQRLKEDLNLAKKRVEKIRDRGESEADESPATEEN